MTPATNIYLVRHGQTEWNVEHRMQGHQDSPLTELGLVQAQWLAEAFADKPLDLIYSSTSYRVFRTAEIIKNNKNIAIVQLDEFREINLGVWEGQNQSDLKAAYPEQFNNFWNNPEAYHANGGLIRSYKKSIVIIVGLALIYVLFFPSPTPEMAVRMSLLVRQPILAFSSSIEKGKIVDDPQYGDLYIMENAKRPNIYVKKTQLGWVANAGGTAP